MGQVAYRANLSSATYPMTISDGGRTVIIPGPDNNYDRRVDPTGQQLDAGIPQALYMENVVPTTNGYQSVGYVKAVNNISLPSGVTIKRKFDIYSGDGITVKNHALFQNSDNSLRTLSGPVAVVGTAIPANSVISTAVISRFAYLYEANSKALYIVTEPGGLLTLTETVSVTPIGFFSTFAISYIINCANYLIAVSEGTVYWSSTTNPIDFISSLVSGAGSIEPNDLIGRITAVIPSPNGFYLYTEFSVVYAQYTGNARYPFKFIPVKNVNGLKDQFTGSRYNLISGGFNKSGQVFIDKNNLLKYMERDQAQDIISEVADYLFRESTVSVFDTLTNTFTLQIKPTIFPSIYVFENRYLLISINDNSTSIDIEYYDYVIVYDFLLKRLGKLKIKHNFIVEDTIGFGAIGLPEKTMIGFVDGATGEKRFVNFDIYNAWPPSPAFTQESAQGVLLLGKFQYVRSRMMQMEEIEVEGPQNASVVLTQNFSSFLIPSLDGRNFDSPISLTPSYQTGGVAKYYTHNTAQNHSVLFKGAFNINTVELKFVPGGDR